jgi:integrase/recombinase XerD
MAHQFVRAPLRAEEADRLANACRSPEEKLIVWTLLDTGLRVSELCSLTRDNVQWQQLALRVTGKAGPHGSRRKQRIVPLSARARAILEPYFALNDAWFVGPRQAQKGFR